MKRLNKKGFTLIELLAVITIMGILMLVAIPAVSRTIENSRRDTFGDVAQAYLNAVRNAVIADELECAGKNVSATAEGFYYFEVATEAGHAKATQTKDLMESGGLSSWGNADVHGYVVWHKSYTPSTSTTAAKTTFEYYIDLRDAGNHGTKGYVRDQGITRARVHASGADPIRTYNQTAAVSGAAGTTDFATATSAGSATATECELK